MITDLATLPGEFKSVTGYLTVFCSPYLLSRKYLFLFLLRNVKQWI